MLNFALVGCGRIAKRHADLLKNNQIQNARLVAVCDTVLDRAKGFGQKYEVPHYLDMDEMMKKEKIDVVSVLTPSGMHAEHVLRLADHGQHIVVEKPMALTLTDADAMIQKCEEKGIHLFVVKQNRFNVPVVKMREAFSAGRFGQIVMGTVRVRWSRDQSYYDQDSWRGTWRYDGGVFTNQASHHVDLLLWMLGEVETVYARSGTFLVKTETEDTGVAILKFTSGALGVIEATTAVRPKDLEGSISILGSGGTVEISGFAVNEIRHWDFVDESPEDATVRKNFSVNPPNVYGFGHKTYLDHVVEVVESGKAALVSGLEGRKSLEVLTAIYESIETGCEVNMRFKTSTPFKANKCRLGLEANKGPL